MERYISMTYVMFYMTYVIKSLNEGNVLAFLFSFLSFSGARNDDLSWHLCDIRHLKWSTMVLEIKSRQWLSKIVNNSAELVEILKEADNICRYCEPISPMICIERCAIWRAKNEFLEMNGMLCADNHVHNLLNAVKNDRRQKVIEALSGSPHSIKGLQEYLKSKGYYHSQHTVASEYVEPLVKAGLVKKDDAKYRLTLYGQKFRNVLNRFNVENPLPPHSRCNEEIVLKKLKDGPKTYADLVGSMAQKSLSRSLRRLTENGLVAKSKSMVYVFYFRTKKVPKKPFSPTEKKVYETIPEVGTSASELSKKVGINLRRTYKYLRRLRKRRLVFTRKKSRTYELTPHGLELANFLEETANLILDASKASAFLLERSKQTTETPAPLLTEFSPRPLQQSTS
jgi:predicted transcriptional regulator